ncbi:hypothetical protein [Brachyspira aalborgi]|uniref:Uncharacterized protein n=1 Tax=Brachyspira aalborgi TaxID=29522 RepID=A0A5C8FQ47_9SPIR|nr:hypothetical protein [Brachyspira aalborgi]TXJ51700.1 hypothetical protein EPJ84_02805 [Brachyspira aalborgi]
MKKIIFLFLIFSAMLFAKWEVGASYTVGGDPLTTFTTYDLEEKGASIVVGVNVNYDYSVVTIRINDKIKKDDDLVLIVTDNEDNDINCTFHSDDIRDYRITVPSNRASVLTKMLYNGKSATLKINGEVYDTFDLRGIKQVMQKHVGKSYWYKYKLND